MTITVQTQCEFGCTLMDVLSKFYSIHLIAIDFHFEDDDNQRERERDREGKLQLDVVVVIPIKAIIWFGGKLQVAAAQSWSIDSFFLDSFNIEAQKAVGKRQKKKELAVDFFSFLVSLIDRDF